MAGEGIKPATDVLGRKMED